MTAFTRKYEPLSLAQFVFPTTDTELGIQQWIKSPETPLFLHGPNGTGKTTLTKLLPSVVYPDVEPVVKVLPAHRSVKKLADEIEQVHEQNYHALYSGFFLVIDELQVYSARDLMLLRQSLGHYGKGTYFILASNKKNVDAGLNSRFSMVEIGKASPERWLDRIKWILKQEGKVINDDKALLELAHCSEGDCRKILHNLETAIYKHSSGIK